MAYSHMHGPSELHGSIIALLLGAKEFPNYKALDNPAFSRSNDAILSYLQDGLDLRAEHILNLFDDPASMIDMDERIASFLARTPDAKNVMIFYTGHGGFLSDREYYLVIRSTRKGREHTTGLRIKALAETLGQFAGQKNLFLILDCCFAGEAVREFQSTELTALVETKTFDALPEVGTALLVAASKDEPAISPAENPYTMFSESFIRVLSEGIQGKPARLSLRDVALQTQSLIKARYGQMAVLPEIHSPRQKGVDVAAILLFPNRAVTPAAKRSNKSTSFSPFKSSLCQLELIKNEYTVSVSVISKDFIYSISDLFINIGTSLEVLDQANTQLKAIDPSAIPVRRANLVLRSTPYELWQSIFNEASLQGHRTLTALICSLLTQEMPSELRVVCDDILSTVHQDYQRKMGGYDG